MGEGAGAREEEGRGILSPQGCQWVRRLKKGAEFFKELSLKEGSPGDRQGALPDLGVGRKGVGCVFRKKQQGSVPLGRRMCPW